MKPRLMLLRAKKKNSRKMTTVEGDKPRMRLDKPRRGHPDEAQDKKLVARMIHKHEAHDHKGEKRTKFAEGGQISEDSKREAARLRDEAERDRKLAGPSTLSGIGPMAAGALLSGVSRGRLGRMVGNGLAGAGAAGGIGSGALKLKDSYDKRSEASRIERGQAKDGEEDRKRGGKVCK